MTQEQKLLANFDGCLIMINNQKLTYLYRDELNSKVLQLQENYRSKIGKYLMAKAAHLQTGN